MCVCVMRVYTWPRASTFSSVMQVCCRKARARSGYFTRVVMPVTYEPLISASVAVGRCPNDCSGHGKCVPISSMSVETRAPPVGPALTSSYSGDEVGHRSCTLAILRVRQSFGKLSLQSTRLYSSIRYSTTLLLQCALLALQLCWDSTDCLCVSKVAKGPLTPPSP